VELLTVLPNPFLLCLLKFGDNGSGTYANIISGIGWATAHTGNNLAKVISMAIGATAEGGLTAPINAAVNAGIVVVVAAGGANANACNSYPAGIAACITVGGTDITVQGEIKVDIRAPSSNYGSCIALFAPGNTINSTWIGSPTATKIISGTSPACSHVTGQVAVLRSQYPTYSPQQIKQLLVASGNQGMIVNPGVGSPNTLLYNGCDSFNLKYY